MRNRIFPTKLSDEVATYGRSWKKHSVQKYLFAICVESSKNYIQRESIEMYWIRMISLKWSADTTYKLLWMWFMARNRYSIFYSSYRHYSNRACVIFENKTCLCLLNRSDRSLFFLTRLEMLKRIFWLIEITFCHLLRSIFFSLLRKKTRSSISQCNVQRW